MKWIALCLIILCAAAVPAADAPPATASPETAKAFFADLAARADRAEQAGSFAIAGGEHWYFLTAELKSLGIGAEFWGENAAKVSHIATPDARDPLPAILNFQQQCDKAGVELLLVPVPGKAVVYPEKITGKATDALPRLDRYHAKFYELLQTHGVKVLDPTPLLLRRRNDTDGPMFCLTDSHWSGQACVLTAQMLAEQICTRPWYKAVPKRKYVSDIRRVTITGDLGTMLHDPAISETLNLTMVKEQSAAGSASVESWRESPVVLLGDSHNLIFHGGDDMLATGAGLPDQLAKQLGFPVDLVAVRGSGATPARKSLARRQDNLAGKKLIIWCFTTREFTEGQGWGKVTVVRENAPGGK